MNIIREMQFLRRPYVSVCELYSNKYKLFNAFFQTSFLTYIVEYLEQVKVNKKSPAGCREVEAVDTQMTKIPGRV